MMESYLFTYLWQQSLGTQPLVQREFIQARDFRDAIKQYYSKIQKDSPYGTYFLLAVSYLGAINTATWNSLSEIKVQKSEEVKDA